MPKKNKTEVQGVNFDLPLKIYRDFKKKVITDGTTMSRKIREWVCEYVRGEENA